MLKLYNSLTKKIQSFETLKPGVVTLYTCGPTVYDYPHIGNWRTFVFDDILRRVLEESGYQVIQVMNATDVGHLTGDNIGNADLGEDRLERGAKREGKTVWEVVQFYLDDFLKTREWLNIIPPTYFVRATDNIKEQISLAETLIKKGLAYETSTGVFFDVTKFPQYGMLGGQKLLDKRVAAREEVEEDISKKHPADFALWLKTVGRWKDHQMKWASPWGEGFPGWHIECSAMALKYLGESIDIHTGGVDHIAIHHTNEIAQSEGATGRRFATFWMHGEFLTVNGGRMGKSLGNAYSLHDIIKHGFEPLALRYLYLTAHYRDKLNFTWDSLTSAGHAINNLKELVRVLEKPGSIDVQYWQRFIEAANNDLNTPQSLAVMWEMIRSDIPSSSKAATIIKMDKILGLNLTELVGKKLEIPEKVEPLLKEREEARKNKDFGKSDSIRGEIKKLGFEVLDTPLGQKLKKI